MKNPIKSVIEISKFPFDISQHQLFNLILSNDVHMYLLQPALLGCVDDVAGTIIST